MSAVPPLLGLGPGTETRSPMAAAVLGGLVLSTALSLIVVPSFYVVTDRMKQRLGALVFRKSKSAAAPDAAE
jgi:Cu/Ag efflux pump CusA